MKVQILDRNDSEIKFLLEGVTPAFANTLRRIMMSEVPTMAIEWVDFRKNDSAVVDELLSNRLGQIPLTFDEKVYELPENCKCEGKGCSRCQVELVLKKKGPCVVYSGDLKSSDKDVKPVFDKIPITELFEGNELEFEAIAQLGLGKKHAKWQAAVVGYKNKPVVSVNAKECAGEKCRKCVERCVRKVLRAEKGKIVVTDPIECSLCMQCIEFCPKDAIKVEICEDSFVFVAETASGLKPEEIVERAAKKLEEKVEEFGKALGKLK
jgi:DNA-directed RNA polymerase subunit D